MDALVAEFTKINEQANDGPVIDLSAFRARFSIDMQKRNEEIIRKRVIMQTITEMAKADFARLEKDLIGTGIKVNYLCDERAGTAPYLTITDKCGGQLKHLSYSVGGADGKFYREIYVSHGTSIRCLTLAELMEHRSISDAIYSMYSWNQRNSL